MIGRAAQGRPWIFREIEHFLNTGEHMNRPTISEIESTTIKHVTDLFDFYGVSWEYEPRTFILDEDEDGNPLSAFTPDFYLPDYDVYLEVTTLRQSLVTLKNKKIRQMGERYPEVKVRILYQRDVERLFVTHAA